MALGRLIRVFTNFTLKMQKQTFSEHFYYRWFQGGFHLTFRTFLQLSEISIQYSAPPLKDNPCRSFRSLFSGVCCELKERKGTMKAKLILPHKRPIFLTKNKPTILRP